MQDIDIYKRALKQATSTIEQLISENELLKKKEPIAIIGMGCRLPGGCNSPEDFWRLLSEGGDAISGIPAERWNVDDHYDANMETPGKAYVRECGFLNCSPYNFDAAFFGITPKEAKALDPHQRLLLEVTWEAIENAGINPASLNGSRTGVFVGMSGSDYETAHVKSGDFSLIDPYSLTGIISSTAVGRISYILGLEGPSIPVDTACSSSLVALHLACNSLAAGECDMALVGGVNMMLTPEVLISFCKLRALSPDGRCKTFDASANGYSRGEGCGMIVLKRLETAKQDNDRILAIIKGSALNNDGRSNGMTTPNGLAQRRVISAALDNASLLPKDIDYIEAHGTGTPLGDPIEVEAIAAVIGKGREQSNPIMIGSVKTNIGHLEAAAGVAGIIKLVLSLNRETIPQHIHFNTPNPHIPWSQLPLKVVSKSIAWPRTERPRRAGISGFGFSGTNAHVIIEEPPITNKPKQPDLRSSHLLIMSAMNETALRETAMLYAKHLQHPDITTLSEICNTAATGRNRFAFGLAVAGNRPQEFSEKLIAFAEKGVSTGLYLRHSKTGSKINPVFLFTGQGSQYPGMGKELYDSAPVYKDTLDICDTLFKPLLELSIRDLMHNSSEEELSRTIYTQPAIFSLEYALAKLWQSWGVVPSAVLGHSIGELVAACIAGVLSLESAVTLVAHRGRLMNSLPSGGVMAAVISTEAEVIPLVELYADKVSIAAVNSPGTVVISGEKSGVGAVVENLKQRGISSQYLTVSHAFHSHLMNPVLDEFENIAKSLTFNKPAIPVISNVTGQLAVGEDLITAGYWKKHLRGAVRFSDSLDFLKQQGHNLFLEIGSTATLSSFARQTIGASVRSAVSLKRGVSAWSSMVAALGELYGAGVTVDWRGYNAPYSLQKVALPTYPFQRERYFMNLTIKPRIKEFADQDLLNRPELHPLLGSKADSPSSEIRFNNRLGLSQGSWLQGHAICGSVIIPATAYIEFAFAALRHAKTGNENGDSASPIVVEKARFMLPLILNEDPKSVQTIYNSEKGEVGIYSQNNDKQWQMHAAMEIRSTENVKFSPLLTESTATGVKRDRDTFYTDMLKIDYRYGGVFRSIRNLQLKGVDVLGTVDVPAEEAEKFILHPALLDGCLTLAGASFLYGTESAPAGTILVPVSIEALHFYGKTVSELSVQCVKRENNNISGTFDLYATDKDGEPALQITGLVMRQISNKLLLPASETSSTGLLYKLAWRAIPALKKQTTIQDKWLVLTDNSSISVQFISTLKDNGIDFIELAAKSETYDNRDSCGFLLNQLSFQDISDSLNRLLHDCSQFSKTISVCGDSPAANLNLIRVLLTKQHKTELILITSGVHNPDGTAEKINPHGAAIWGIGATVSAEAPELSCKLIDLPFKPDTAEFTALLSELNSNDGEDRIALCRGSRFAPRLISDNHKKVNNIRYISNKIDSAATYLITGGFGNLGLAVAGMLVDKGCRNLALIGRNRPSSEASFQIEKFRKAGAVVECLTGDVAKLPDITDIFNILHKTMPAVKGIFHAAGTLDDAILSEMDSEKFEHVAQPKIAGAWNLHKATENEKLDMFVLFSSLTAITGSPGQANYAGANAGLDGFARWRIANGLAATSINWGPWTGQGLAAPEGKAERLAARGIGSISTEEGLEILAELLEKSCVEQIVVNFDLNKLSSFVSSAKSGLYAELYQHGTESSAALNSDSAKLDIIRTASETDRPALMLRLLQEIAAKVIGQSDPSRIENSRPLQEQGFDSLMAVDLRNLITKTFGEELPVSLLFDYPTLEKMSDFLLKNTLILPDTEKKGQITAVDDKSADDLVDEIELLLRG